MSRDTTRHKLAKRQGGWVCHWCKRPVYRDVRRGHPQAATIEHIIPLARGGKNDITNYVLACRACNQRRGAPEVTETEAAGEWAESHADVPTGHDGRKRKPQPEPVARQAPAVTRGPFVW